MKSLYTLLAIITVMVASAQAGSYTHGYTLKSFDYEGDSYLFLDGSDSDMYCLDGATETRVEIVGIVQVNGGGITRYLDIDGERHNFIYQSHGQRIFDRIGEIETYPSPGIRDVTKFYRVDNGVPTLIDDPEWALCIQSDYRLPESRVRGVRYYGTSYDGVGRVNGVDPLPTGLYDTTNQRHFRWSVDGNIYTLQLLLNDGSRNDSPGDYIEVQFDEATGGVERLRTYRSNRGTDPIDDVAVPRSYNSYSYVTALIARARKLY